MKLICNILGTTLIVGPAEEVALINSALGSVQEVDGVSIIDCDRRKTAPIFNFDFGEYTIRLDGSDYILDVSLYQLIWPR